MEAFSTLTSSPFTLSRLPPHRLPSNLLTTSISSSRSRLHGRRPIASMSAITETRQTPAELLTDPFPRLETTPSLHAEEASSASEWLQTGNCPIAKCARAISKALPLAGNLLRFSSISKKKLKCPAVVVAVRSAVARTRAVKALRLQPLPARIVAIGLLGFAVNVVLGMWKEMCTSKFSVAWFVAVHASVPLMAMLRKAVHLPKSAMALTLAASILGQIVGSRAAVFVFSRVYLQR